MQASEIPSPAGDFANSKDGHYIIASNKISINAGKNAKAQFLSPFLIGSQHVEECLSFKVYFSVSKSVFLMNIWIEIDLTYFSVARGRFPKNI